MKIASIAAAAAAAFAGVATASSATTTIPLVTFDGAEGTTHSFRETNDPVMGGKSTGSFTIENGVGVFDGQVVDVPFLKAPGFIKVEAETSDFSDISSCKSILINAKASASYDGFRLSIGDKRDASCSFFSSGFKAHFDAPVSDGFQDIKIPLNKFSDCNSDSTGEPTKLCSADPSVCPDAKTLSNVKTLSVWAEGANGKVHLEIKSISGADCAAAPTLADTSCTTYNKIADGMCAEDCLPSMVGICPVGLVVKAGGLSTGSCASLGYTKLAGSISQKAGPCGTLTFKKYAKTSAPAAPLAILRTTSAADTIPMVTFNSGDDTYKTFEELNDPVMGGKSTGGFSVKNGIGQWRGTVAIVPSLKAPGFIKIQSKTSDFKDISSCNAVAITARTGAKYDGYRFSFGTKRGFLCSFFSSGFKSHFDLAPSSDFSTVTIPLSSFSDCNSDSTGEPSRKCDGKGGKYCPDQATLQNVKTVSVWAEGAAGTVDMDIKEIAAVGCSQAPASFTAAADVALVTFDGASGTTHKFKTLNDPVMGGQSNGTFTIQNGVGIFDGNVNIVPKLKAPGFLETWANDGGFADASSAASGGLVLTVRSKTADYTGFKVTFASGAFSTTFSCAAGGSIIGSRGCFKAGFKVPAGDEFVDVYVPFNSFSDKWSSATGEPTTLCSKDSSVCPTASKLKKIQAIGVWAEGAAGYIHLEIKSISARPASSAFIETAELQLIAPVPKRTTRPPKEFDTCSASVQSNLRYNISIFDTPDGVPVNVSATESLATAVCCDKRTKVFAEPRFLFQNPFVNLFGAMRKKGGVTTFYDSVCGLPLFKAPLGRSQDDFEADTTEHGWPSFRPKELITENVVTDKDGFVYSKCGTHLGSYLPDEKGARWCLDLSCLSGNPAGGNLRASPMR